MLCLGSSSCVPGERTSWRDQLVPDSPCYRVNLRDGLDESGPDEVRDLFACMDYHDHFASLRRTVDALEQPSAEQAVALTEVAVAGNQLVASGVDPLELIDVSIDLLRDAGDPLDGLLDLSVELATGYAAVDVRAGNVDTDDPALLRAGVLAPLAPTVPTAAQALLDDDLQLISAVGEGMRSETAHRWVHSAGDLARSPHPDIRRLVDEMPAHAGEALLATRDGVDGLWLGGSEDSLRDLVAVMVGDEQHEAAMSQLAPHLGAILADEGARTRLGAALRTLERDGALDDLPSELGWLARVDVDGGLAGRGEVSGLEALVRLLDGANRPMTCSIDIIGAEFSVNLGNLSVSLLRLVADLDPGTVQSGAGIVGDLVEADLSQSLLRTIADTGVCPALTEQLVDDLLVLDLLFDDRAHDLVRVFLAVTDALEREGQLEAFVDTTSVLWRTDAIWAAGDVLRDTADEPLWDDIMAAVPILLDPGAYGLPADGVGFDDAWALVDTLVQDPDLGWQATAPVVAPFATDDGVWEAAGSLGKLLRNEKSTLSDSIALLDAYTRADPELTLLDTAGTLFAEPSVSAPVLRLAALPEVSEELLRSTPAPNQQQVPLAFWTRLVREGALDDLLALTESVVGALETHQEAP